MANKVFNVAKGRIVELYKRVKNNDPANCALVVIPIETAGLQSDAVLEDMDTLADILAGSTNEQTTMGRKILTDVELAALPAPDDGNDRRDIALPSITWVAAAGNPISKIIVAYDPDTTSGTDSTIEPLTIFDAVASPDTTDLVLNDGAFFRAS